MRKLRWIVCVFLLLVGMVGVTTAAYADEMSDNKLELVFTPTKLWKSGNNLCLTGTFHNKKANMFVVKIKSFDPNITLKKADGTEVKFHGQPIKFPFCTLKPGDKKTVTYNFGEYREEWHTWYSDPNYVYQIRDIF